MPPQKNIQFREVFKDYANSIQSIFTVLAIIAGGTWFLVQGLPFAKANISHEITHRQISKDKIWVHVSVSINNVGKRPVLINSGVTQIQQILPLDASIENRLNKKARIIPSGERLVDWPYLDIPYEEKSLNTKIQPGETDILNYEFEIPAYVKTVKVHSFFKNESEEGNFGWEKATVYDIKKRGF